MPRFLEPTYRDTFVAAGKSLLRHPFLSVLGAMAMLVGQFGLGNFLGSLWSFIVDGEVTLLPLVPREVTWHLVSFGETLQFAALLIMMCALGVFIIVMAVCAQGAVVAAGVQFTNGKKSVTLGSLWHGGAKHFWRILAVNAVEQIILLCTVSSLIGFWRDFSHHDVSGVIMLIIGMTLGLFIALVTSVVSIYTIFYIVDKEYSLSDAVGAGYDLFKNHLLVSLEISVLLLLAVIFPAAAVWIASYVVLIPAIPFWFVGAFSGNIELARVGTLLHQGLFAIAIALIGGAFNAFIMLSWAYCYRAMDKKGVSSRLEHHVKKLFVSESQKRVRMTKGRIS